MSGRRKARLSLHRGSVFAGHHSGDAGMDKHLKNAHGLIHVEPTYLQKRSKARGVLPGRWQRRWFSLSNNYLLYSKSEADAEAAATAKRLGTKRGNVHATTIDLRLVEAVTEGSGDFEFHVVLGTAVPDADDEETEDGPSSTLASSGVTQSSIFRIKATSRRECEKWMKAIVQRRNFAPVGTPVPATPTAILDDDGDADADAADAEEDTGAGEPALNELEDPMIAYIAEVEALERDLEATRAALARTTLERNAALAAAAASNAASALRAEEAAAEKVAGAASASFVATAVAQATAAAVRSLAPAAVPAPQPQPQPESEPPQPQPQPRWHNEAPWPRDEVDVALALARGAVRGDASDVSYVARLAANLARTVAGLNAELAQLRLDVARGIRNGRDAMPTAREVSVVPAPVPPPLPRPQPAARAQYAPPAVHVNRHGSILIRGSGANRPN